MRTAGTREPAPKTYPMPPRASVTVTDATGATAITSVRVAIGRTPMMARKPVMGDDILVSLGEEKFMIVKRLGGGLK